MHFLQKCIPRSKPFSSLFSFYSITRTLHQIRDWEDHAVQTVAAKSSPSSPPSSEIPKTRQEESTDLVSEELPKPEEFEKNIISKMRNKFREREASKSRTNVEAVRSWSSKRADEDWPRSLLEVNKERRPLDWRIPLSGELGKEVSQVLGGGLVPGSLVLVGGDPGVGKSTLILQVSAIIAEGNQFNGSKPAVVYVSGEESIYQIGDRADRMRIGAAGLFLYSSTDIKDILHKIRVLNPKAVVIDSIHTMYLKGVTGSAGNKVQIRECTYELMLLAKQTNIPIILVGHVTKTGDIAGPHVLEHIVDAVFYLEGERRSYYRLLRSVKNRYGSTDELGVFEMTEYGLKAVSNPSEMFLTEYDSASGVFAGLATAVIVDGSRTFLIEIQALCSDGLRRSRNLGVLDGRASMIIDVLVKQAGMELQNSSILCNVVSGYKVTETAGDLAIAAAMCSSFLEFPIPRDVAFIGEIGLGGELHKVARMEKRVAAMAKLGYKRCVIPKTAEKLLQTLSMDMEIVACRNLKEMINYIFGEVL